MRVNRAVSALQQPVQKTPCITIIIVSVGGTPAFVGRQKFTQMSTIECVTPYHKAVLLAPDECRGTSNTHDNEEYKGFSCRNLVAI
jgi:hypothetical protein